MLAIAGEAGEALGRRGDAFQLFFDEKGINLRFELPAAGRWVIGVRVTDPAVLGDEKNDIDATAFCTANRGRSISDTIFINSSF